MSCSFVGGAFWNVRTVANFSRLQIRPSESLIEPSNEYSGKRHHHKLHAAFLTVVVLGLSGPGQKHRHVLFRYGSSTAHDSG